MMSLQHLGFKLTKIDLSVIQSRPTVIQRVLPSAKGTMTSQGKQLLPERINERGRLDSRFTAFLRLIKTPLWVVRIGLMRIAIQ